MAVTAAVVGIAATLASTGYAASEQRDARRTAIDERRDAKNESLANQSELERQAQSKEAQEAASRAAAEARKRQLASMTRGYGRAGTLLTGPQGLGGGPEPLGA